MMDVVSLKLLMVDDNTEFLELSKNWLERHEGLEVTIASSPEQARHMLDGKSFHAIVSDYQMPGENGLQFLRSVRDSDPDIPFILFTGKGREEIAIEALNGGADLYLRKGSDLESQYAELLNMVNQCIARKRAEDRMKDHARRFESFLENGDDMIITADESLKIHFASPSIRRILGYDETRAKGLKIEDYLPEHQRERVVGNLKGLLRGVPVKDVIFEILDSDGKPRLVRGNGAAIPNPDGPERIVLTAKDISSEWEMIQRAEESERQLRSLYENMEEGMLILRAIWEGEHITDYIVEDMNSRFGTIFGTSRERIIGRSVREILGGENPPELHLIEELINGDRPIIRMNIERGDRNLTASLYDLGNDKVGALLFDETDRIKRTRQLEMMRHAIDASITGMGISDTNMDIIYANKTLAKMWGLDSPEDLIGRNNSEFWERPEEIALAKEELRTRGEWEGEMTARRVDGTHFASYMFVSEIRDDEGERIGVIGSFLDISKKKELENDLNEQIARYDELLDNVDAEVWIASGPRTYGQVNWAFAEFIGKTKKELEGCHIEECRSPFEIDACLEGNRVAFEDRVTYVSEEWKRNKDGEDRLKRVTKVPILDEMGEVKYLVCTASDITDELRAKESGSWLGTIVDQSENEVYIFDPETLRFIYANKGALENTGYSMEEMLQMRTVDLKSEFTPEQFMEVILPLRQEEKEQLIFEATHRRNDGSTYDVEVRMHRSRMANRPVMLSMVIDITRRKRLKRELSLANKKLELMGRVTRHDILNQLSLIMGYGTLLEEGNDAPYIKKMMDAANEIDNQLRIQREFEALGTGRPEWTSLKDLVERGISGLSLEDIGLQTEGDGIEILADPLMEKVIHNIIMNSIQHGGGVRRFKVGANSVGDYLLLHLEDDGVGIPQDEKELIFKHGYGNRTGLGLFLIRQILEADGMEIVENGIEGKGCRFEIVVPRSRWRRE